MRIKKIIILFLSVFLIFQGTGVLAAANGYCYFIGDSQHYVADIFYVDVFMNTGDNTVNVVEGTISLGGGSVEIVSVDSKNTSNVDFWINTPVASGNSIYYAGGIFSPGMKGQISLFRIKLRAVSVGHDELVNNGTVYLHDGEGTVVYPGRGVFDINVIAGPEVEEEQDVEKEVEEVKDAPQEVDDKKDNLDSEPIKYYPSKTVDHEILLELNTGNHSDGVWSNDELAKLSWEFFVDGEKEEGQLYRYRIVPENFINDDFDYVFQYFELKEESREFSLWDGPWNFQLEVYYDNKWQLTKEVRLLIDTTPPVLNDLNLNIEYSDEKNRLLQYDFYDKMSGVQYYLVENAGGAKERLDVTEYMYNVDDTNKLVLTAIDRAGNSVEIDVLPDVSYHLLMKKKSICYILILLIIIMSLIVGYAIGRNNSKIKDKNKEEHDE